MDELRKNSMKRDRSELVRELSAAGAKFRGNAFACLWHDDRHPSAGIYEKDGLWSFKCQVCGKHGDVFDVMAFRQGKTVDEVLSSFDTDSTWKPNTAKAKDRKWWPTVESLVANYRSDPHFDDFYVYANPDTHAADVVLVRIKRADGSKSIFQHRPAAGGGFEAGGPSQPYPLFNRTRLRTAQEAWVVEGENKVKAMQRLGYVATCSIGGAGKAHLVDWAPLAGKTCYLWPDNDKPGISHMEDVAQILSNLGCKLFWINPEELGLDEKEDVVDWLRVYEKDDEEASKGLEMVKATASKQGPAQELQQLLNDIIAGKLRSIPWPHRGLTTLARALLPGKVICICGDPGCGKSFHILESAAHWIDVLKVDTAIYELEDDRAYHLHRALAQRERLADLTDYEWILRNPEEARQAFARHSDFLSAFGACITTGGDDVKLADVLAWVKKQCDAKKRIIVIDPITVADSGERPWIEDRKFILAAKAMIRASGSSLVLVTHPKTGVKKSGGIDGMAGGASYPRFAHTVLWIHRHEKPRRVSVRCDHGGFKTTINRSIKISKARNGPGTGIELGYFFDPKSLLFVEQGVIVKDLEDETSTVEGVFP